MSYFSAALHQILDDRPELTQVAFARAGGISPVQLSRYLSGENRPDVISLGLICAASDLTDPERAALLIAYLRDDLPADAAHLIQLRSVVDTPRTAEPEPSSAQLLPRQARADFEFLMRLALREPSVLTWIRATVDLLQRS